MFFEPTILVGHHTNPLKEAAMKKLADPHRTVKAEVIGLDVHQSMIVCCRLDRSGCTKEWSRVAAKRASLCTWLDETVGRRRTHFALEASRSSLWVYDLLAERYGRERVHLAHSRRIQAIANTQQKNDRNDAWWLAYLTREGRLPEAYVPPQAVLELRIATRERRAVVERRTKIINRMRSHLAQLGEVVPGSTCRTQKALAWLERMAEQTPGARGEALRRCLEELTFVEGLITQWDESIEGLASDLPTVRLIREEMPGMGTLLAATVVAEVGEIERFKSAKSFARYSGLTPSDRSSGGRMWHGGITREGSPHLRWALTQATMACSRSRRGAGLAVGEWIRAKQRRMGHRAKARAAAARKLAESIWRLVHYGELFDVARPFGGLRRAA